MVMVRKVEVEASEACNEPTEVVFCYGNGGGGVRPIGVAWWRCRGFGLWVLAFLSKETPSSDFSLKACPSFIASLKACPSLL